MHMTAQTNQNELGRQAVRKQQMDIWQEDLENSHLVDVAYHCSPKTFILGLKDIDHILDSRLDIFLNLFTPDPETPFNEFTI